MKKNKIVISSLLGLLAVSTLASVNSQAKEVGKTVSKGKVSFTDAPSLPPSPYDPTDPNFPPANIEENPDGEGKGTTGALRFERVPNFDFGTTAVELGDYDLDVLDESYQLVDSSGKPTGTPFYSAPTIEVTDGRGSAPGWNVKVVNNGVFKSTTAGVPDFKATIKLNSLIAAPYTEGVALADAPACLPNGAIELNSVESLLIDAAELKGNAKWGFSFYDTTDASAVKDGKPVRRTTQSKSNAVELHIPTATKVTAGANYTTDITWVLNDTPA